MIVNICTTARIKFFLFAPFSRRSCAVAGATVATAVAPSPSPVHGIGWFCAQGSACLLVVGLRRSLQRYYLGTTDTFSEGLCCYCLHNHLLTVTFLVVYTSFPQPLFCLMIQGSTEAAGGRGRSNDTVASIRSTHNRIFTVLFFHVLGCPPREICQR